MTSRFCATCDASDPRHQCSRCKRVYYCGSGCQRTNWPDHKRACNELFKDALIRSLLIGNHIDNPAYYNMLYHVILPRLDTPSYFNTLHTHKGLREYVLSHEMGRIRHNRRIAISEAMTKVWRTPVLLAGLEPYEDGLGRLDFRDIKEVVLKALEADGLTLEHARGRFKRDPEAVLTAVKQNGNALQFADPELKRDKRIVRAAMRFDKSHLQYARKTVRKDPDFMKHAIFLSEDAIDLLHPSLQKNKAFMIDIVDKVKDGLRHASPELQDDRDVVIAAVSQWPSAIKHASYRLQNDPTVKEIAKKRERELEVIRKEATRLRKLEKKEAIETVKRKWSALVQIPQFQDDKDVVLAAIHTNGLALSAASERLRDDKEVVLESVKHDAFNVRYASQRLQKDPDVLKAVQESRRPPRRWHR